MPKKIDGVDEVEIVILDDGSTDKTIEVAKALGLHHIVNTDGDNQYAGWAILKLMQPILDGKADVVVGDRNTAKVAHFSPFKNFYKG
jgi:glycosyltransferase involved in cell wall biosynthesis